MFISLCRNVCCHIFGFLLKISVLLSHPSVPQSCWRHGRNMVAALWPWVKLWLVLHCLGSPLEGLAGAPALPLALPSIGACTSLKSVVPQRKSCFSHCVSPLPTFPLLSHCASKARGVCTEVLLWALCKLSPGNSPYSHIRRRNLSLELDAGYWRSGKGLCFLLSEPDFPMEPIVHQRWG